MMILKKLKMSEKKKGFFKEQRTDLTISQPKSPENNLCYVNQRSISPIKGKQAIYLEFIVIGQILPFANPDPKIDLDHYDFKDMKFCCLLLRIIQKLDCIKA